jgi:CheY-like chemotaxis protein
LDLHLPKISDGLDLLSNIKQNEKTKNIPVVILTCSAHPKSIDECKRLGVSVFIEKPLLYENFIKAIKTIYK